MKNKKYVATLWINEYDYDGLTCYFEVLGIFGDPKHGRHFVASASEAAREVGLKNQGTWHDMDIAGTERPTFGDVNGNHDIVCSKAFKIGDGTGYNSSYQYFDLIEVGIHQPIDVGMFIGDGRYAFEIGSFFDTWHDKTIDIFSYDEGVSWLKRNPGKTPPQGWQKFNAQLEALDQKSVCDPNIKQ